VGKLGFTVTSGRMISKMIAAGYTPTQRGDGEATFSCAWTAENIHKLKSLLRIQASSSSNPTTVYSAKFALKRISEGPVTDPAGNGSNFPIK
jgi:hypothetical protein